MKSLQLSKPHLIAVVGIPGAGKTFFAKQFSDTFSAPYIDQSSLRSMLPDDDTTAVMCDYVIDQLCRTKQTILIEGPGATKASRRDVAELAKRHGYQPLFIWVQTEPITAQTRATKGVGPNRQQLMLISDSEFDALSREFEPLLPSEKYMVISGKHTYASQAKIVLKKLVEPRTDHVNAMPIDAQVRSAGSTDSPLRRSGRITIN